MIDPELNDGVEEVDNKVDLILEGMYITKKLKTEIDLILAEMPILSPARVQLSSRHFFTRCREEILIQLHGVARAARILNAIPVSGYVTMALSHAWFIITMFTLLSCTATTHAYTFSPTTAVDSLTPYGPFIFDPLPPTAVPYYIPRLVCHGISFDYLGATTMVGQKCIRCPVYHIRYEMFTAIKCIPTLKCDMFEPPLALHATSTNQKILAFSQVNNKYTILDVSSTYFDRSYSQVRGRMTPFYKIASGGFYTAADYALYWNTMNSLPPNAVGSVVYCRSSRGVNAECGRVAFMSPQQRKVYNMLSKQGTCASLSSPTLVSSNITVKTWTGGVVRVKVGVSWYWICDQGLGQSSSIAKVLARQVGVRSFTITESPIISAWGIKGLKGVVCTGSEEKIQDCKYKKVTCSTSSLVWAGKKVEYDPGLIQHMTEGVPSPPATTTHPVPTTTTARPTTTTLAQRITTTPTIVKTTKPQPPPNVHHTFSSNDPVMSLTARGPITTAVVPILSAPYYIPKLVCHGISFSYLGSSTVATVGCIGCPVYHVHYEKLSLVVCIPQLDCKMFGSTSPTVSSNQKVLAYSRTDQKYIVFDVSNTFLPRGTSLMTPYLVPYFKIMAGRHYMSHDNLLFWYHMDGNVYATSVNKPQFFKCKTADGFSFLCGHHRKMNASDQKLFDTIASVPSCTGSVAVPVKVNSNITVKTWTGGLMRVKVGTSWYWICDQGTTYSYDVMNVLARQVGVKSFVITKAPWEISWGTAGIAGIVCIGSEATVQDCKFIKTTCTGTGVVWAGRQVEYSLGAVAHINSGATLPPLPAVATTHSATSPGLPAPATTAMPTRPPSITTHTFQHGSTTVDPNVWVTDPDWGLKDTDRSNIQSNFLADPSHMSAGGIDIVRVDMRTQYGSKMLYDRSNGILWESQKTLMLSADPDEIYITKEFNIPLPPVDAPLMNVNIKSVMTLLKTLGFSAGSNYQLGSLKCFIDALVPVVGYFFPCGTGGNSKAIRKLNEALKATTNAIHSNGKAIVAVVKGERQLGKAINTLKNGQSKLAQEIMSNRMAIKHDMLAISSSFNNELKSVVNMTMQHQEFDNWDRAVQIMLDYIVVLDQAISMSGATVPMYSAIYRLLKGDLQVPGHNYHMEDCVMTQGVSTITGMNYKAAFHVLCSRNQMTYDVYKPAPLYFSYDGKEWVQPRPSLLNYHLIGSQNVVFPCDKHVTIRLDTYDFSKSAFSAETSDNVCIVSKMMAVEKDSLSLCHESESRYDCKYHVINPFSPTFLDKIMFPLDMNKVTKMVKTASKLYYPYVQINSFAILQSAADVYSPPHINHAMPAGSIFSLPSIGGGYVNPYALVYKNSHLQSVSLPVISLQSTRTYNRSTIIISPKSAAIDKEHVIIETGANRTEEFIRNMTRQDLDFYNSLSGYINNFTGQIDDRLNTLERELNVSDQGVTNSSLQIELARQLEKYIDAMDLNTLPTMSIVMAALTITDTIAVGAIMVIMCLRGAGAAIIRPGLGVMSSTPMLPLVPQLATNSTQWPMVDFKYYIMTYSFLGVAIILWVGIFVKAFYDWVNNKVGIPNHWNASKLQRFVSTFRSGCPIAISACYSNLGVFSKENCGFKIEKLNYIGQLYDKGLHCVMVPSDLNENLKCVVLFDNDGNRQMTDVCYWLKVTNGMFQSISSDSAITMRVNGEDVRKEVVISSHRFVNKNQCLKACKLTSKTIREQSLNSLVNNQTDSAGNSKVMCVCKDSNGMPVPGQPILCISKDQLNFGFEMADYNIIYNKLNQETKRRVEPFKALVVDYCLLLDFLQDAGYDVTHCRAAKSISSAMAHSLVRVNSLKVKFKPSTTNSPRMIYTAGQLVQA